MSSYLPKDSTGSSPYAEGGGLYAIGLIHANHGLRVMDYITQELKANNSEVLVVAITTIQSESHTCTSSLLQVFCCHVLPPVRLSDTVDALDLA